MDALRKFIVALVGWTLMVATGISVMIYGWGLSPKNWLIVILGNSIGFLIGQIFIAASK